MFQKCVLLERPPKLDEWNHKRRLPNVLVSRCSFAYVSYIQLHKYISVSTSFPSDQTLCRSKHFHVIRRRTKTTKTTSSITTIKGGLAQHKFSSNKKIPMEMREPQNTNYQSLVVSTFNPLKKNVYQVGWFSRNFVGVKVKQKMKPPPGSTPWQKEKNFL